MPVSVSSPPGLRGLAAPLRALVRATLAQEGRRAGEMAVVLAHDETLRDLNRRWRGLDRATDVLSFAYDDGLGAVADGDLVVSLERVREQARRFRVTPGRELARLVIHGALHLAGLDHQNEAERRRMRAREDRALRGAREEIAELERAFESAPAPRRSAGARRRGGPVRRRGPTRRGGRVRRPGAARNSGTRERR